MKKILMLLAATMVLSGAATQVQATTYTAVSTGDFSSPSTFSPSGTPGSADTVVVSNGVTLTVSDTRTITVLTVGKSGGSGATLTISSAGSLTVTGTYGFAGTSPAINNNGTFSCGGGALFSTGAFNNNGTATFSGNPQAFNGTIAVTQGANATLNFPGPDSTPFGGSSTLSATASGNTVSYGGGNNMFGTTYYNLSVSGTSPSVHAGTTVNGTLTIALSSGQQVNSAANITFGSGANIVRTLGALSGTPTFGGPINVTYNGTAAMTTGSELPTGSSALHNLTITSTAGVTLNANATVNGAFSATYNGSKVPLAAGSKTLAFSSSPVNITVSGSALASGNAYTMVSSSGTTISGSLGTVTVTGAGAPYTSPTASTSTGQLILTIPTCTSTTAAPSITAPIPAGATSISGTSVNGASIGVFDLTSSIQIGTATADGSGAWTAAVAAATGGDSIAATAQTAGSCTSPASTAVTVESNTSNTNEALIFLPVANTNINAGTYLTITNVAYVTNGTAGGGGGGGGGGSSTPTSLGSWQNNTGDGWIDWGDLLSITNSSNTGIYTFASGVVSGYPQSLEITDSGNHQNLAIKLENIPGGMAAFLTNNQLSFTFSVPSSASAGVSAGFSQVYQLAINASGYGFNGQPFSNFTETGTTNNNQSGQPNFYFSSGTPAQSQVVTVNYSNILSSITATPTTGYIELIFSFNNGGGAPAYYYMNNVVLSHN